MNALTKIYTGARDCPALAAELEALIRYRWATCLAPTMGASRLTIRRMSDQEGLSGVLTCP